MKTEPTEALKTLDFWGFYHNDDEEEYIDFNIATKAVNLAFKEGQSNPKIKQLEWEVHGSMYYVNQYNPIGYVASIREWFSGKKQYSVQLRLNDGNNSAKFFNSIEEAKDFVQKDYEARIKECLITE